MNKFLSSITISLFILELIVLSGCADASRREEINRRREALEQKDSTTLAQTRQRLAIVDSMLMATNAEHDSLHAWVMAHASQLNDASPEVIRLSRLRAHRDSLQVEWQTLGRTISHILKNKR